MADDDTLVRLLGERGDTLAVAESLTGGALCSCLAQRPRASEWFRGGVVAYSSEVKHRVLGVRPVPVVSREAAIDMARGVSQLLGSSIAIAVTGVGGPQPQDGIPPGTVWVAMTRKNRSATACLELSGTPAEIVELTCRRTVELLEQQLSDS